MKKFIILVMLVGCLLFTGCGVKNGNITGDYKEEDLTNLINDVYEKIGSENLPMTASMNVDVTDLDSLSYYTGLKDNNDIEYVVASEPMMGSQAYSFVLVKVANDADIDSLKQDIYDNIDTRKWICVEAENLYVTNYDTVIAIIMADSEWADPIYNEFSKVVKDNLGSTLDRKMEI